MALNILVLYPPQFQKKRIQQRLQTFLIDNAWSECLMSPLLQYTSTEMMVITVIKSYKLQFKNKARHW